MKHWKWLIASMLLALANLAAATTYSFTGQPYSSATGLYTTAMNITGSFTTAAPLPPNMAGTQIGPGGSNLVTSWSFFDGVSTFNNSNSMLLYGGASYFTVATDAAGNISSFVIGFMSPQGPHTVGQPINAIFVSPSTQATTAQPCGRINGSGVCDAINANGANYAEVAAGGAWATRATPAVPVPATSNTLLVLMALGLGWLAFRQKRLSR